MKLGQIEPGVNVMSCAEGLHPSSCLLPVNLALLKRSSSMSTSLHIPTIQRMPVGLKINYSNLFDYYLIRVEDVKSIHSWGFDTTVSSASLKNATCPLPKFCYAIEKPTGGELTILPNYTEMVDESNYIHIDGGVNIQLPSVASLIRLRQEYMFPRGIALQNSNLIRCRVNIGYGDTILKINHNNKSYMLKILNKTEIDEDMDDGSVLVYVENVLNEANKHDVGNDSGCSDLNLLDILPQDYEIQDLLEKSKNLTNYSKQTYCIRLPKCVYNFRRRLNNYFMETFADASVQRDVIYPLVEVYSNESSHLLKIEDLTQQLTTLKFQNEKLHHSHADIEKDYAVAKSKIHSLEVCTYDVYACHILLTHESLILFLVASCETF